MTHSDATSSDARAFLHEIAGVVLTGVPLLLKSAQSAVTRERAADPNSPGSIATDALSRCATIVAEANRRIEQASPPA